MHCKNCLRDVTWLKVKGPVSLPQHGSLLFVNIYNKNKKQKLP